MALTVRRTGVGLAFAGFVLIGLGGGATGVLLPAQIAFYHVDKSVIGLLFVSFSTGYLVASVANGWLVEHIGVRGQLVLGTTVFSGATLLCAGQPAYGVLVALTALFGAGTGVIDSGLNAHVATLPGHTGLLNLLHACYGLGALLGPPLAVGLLRVGAGWGGVYLVFAGLAAPLAIGFALRLPGVERSGATGSPAAAPVPGATAGGSPLAVALRHPAILLSALFLSVYVGVEVSLGNWGYSFLVEERGHGSILAGWVISGFWLSLTVGRFALGALAGRLGAGPAGLTLGCVSGMGAGMVLIWLVPAPLVAAVTFIVVGAFLGPVFPLTIALLPRLAPARLVTTAVGVLVGTSVIGGALFPWLVGDIAERVGLDSLPPLSAALCAGLAVNWWWISRRLAPGI